MGCHTGRASGFVDYVLWGDDGLPLGLGRSQAHQARPASRPPAGQALRRLSRDSSFGQRPLIFYTNGYDTWLWDDTRYPPRDMQGFYTKDELALRDQPPDLASSARRASRSAR